MTVPNNAVASKEVSEEGKNPFAMLCTEADLQNLRMVSRVGEVLTRASY